MTTVHEWQPLNQPCPNCGTKLEFHTRTPGKVHGNDHVACPALNCETQGQIAASEWGSSDIGKTFRIDWTSDDCDYD